MTRNMAHGARQIHKVLNPEVMWHPVAIVTVLATIGVVIISSSCPAKSLFQGIKYFGVRIIQAPKKRLEAGSGSPSPSSDAAQRRIPQEVPEGGLG